jgi:hypothetical protein
MMRTGEQIWAQLEEADRSLSEAVAQLLAGPVQNPGFHKSLETAAQLLGALPTEPRPQGAVLHNLQANAARAQRLLDAAAAFYGCSISPASSDPAVYTADGLLHSQG